MKGKHTIQKLAVLLLLALSVLLVLSACGTPAGEQCEHQWGDWVTETEATCATKGAQKRTCSLCNETESKEVSPTGVHTYGEWTTVTAATCIGKGSEKRVCSGCNNDESRELPASGLHTPDRDIATCQHDQLCSVCNTVLSTGTHNYKDVVTDPTCTAQGYTTSTCEYCNDVEVRNPVNATGHTPDILAATCSAAQTCSACHEVLAPKLDHHYVLDANKSTAPTCEADGVEYWACDNGDGCTAFYTSAGAAALGHSHTISATTTVSCDTDATETWTCTCGDSYVLTLQSRTGHDYSACVRDDSSEKLVSGCLYEYTYKGDCTKCHQHVEQKQQAAKHTYSATVTKEATCQADGVKTYTCSVCQDHYNTAIEKSPDHHVYPTVGTVSGNVTTYKCNHCDNKITTIAVKDKQEATVPATDLQNTGTLELKDASITLDSGVQSGLSGNVQIKAETLDVNDPSLPALTEKEKEAIGNNKIYNFGLTSNGQDKGKELGGKITISVPYELGPNEDPDLIAIWYIDDQGNVKSYPATYSNGMATFVVDHFSYYTVTKLTPEERCGVYGHSWMPDVVIAPTCLEEGYTLKVCFRCGHTEKIDVKEALGHHMVADTVNSTVASCLTAGKNITKCDNPGCTYHTVEILPATGHSMVADSENSSAATCETNGKTVTKCEHEGCNYKTVKLIPATGHTWSATTTELATCEKAGYVEYTCSGCSETYRVTLPQLQHKITVSVVLPTCTEGGYTLHDCSACDYSSKDAHTPAAGHKYEDVVTPPTCTVDGYTTHTCSVCGDNYKDTPVPAGHKYDIAEPTCGQGQTCTVCGEAGKPATGNHTMGANGICSVCGAGCNHQYNDVVTAPTCQAGGYTTHTCSACGHTYTDSETAKVAHNYVSGVCTMCQKPEATSPFYMNLISSIAKQNWTLTVNDLKVSASSLNPSFSASLVTEIDYAELVIGTDENGRLVGYASGTVITYPKALPSYKETYKLSATIEENVAYVVMEQAGSSNSNMSGDTVVKPNPDGSIGGVVTPSYPTYGYTYQATPAESFYVRMSVEEMLSFMMGEAAEEEGMPLSWIQKDLLPYLEKLINQNSTSVNRALEVLFNEFFTVTETADGCTIKLDGTKVNQFVTMIGTQNVGQIVDHYLGAGGYDKLSADIIKLMNMPFSELRTKLEAAGIKVEEVRALLDSLAVELSGGECSTFEAYLELSTNGQIKIKIDEYLNNNEFMSSSLADILAEMQGAPAQYFTKMIEKTLAQYKGMTLSEMGEEMTIPVKQITDAVTNIFKSFSLEITTNKEGEIRALSMKADKLQLGTADDGALLNGSFNASTGMKPTGDYSKLADAVNAILGKVNLTEANAGALGFVFDDATGALIGYSTVEKTVAWSNTVNYEGQQLKAEYITEEGAVYSFTKEELFAMMAISSYCGDWIDLSAGNITRERVDRQYMVLYNTDGSPKLIEIVYDYGNISNGYGFNFYYNTKTGEISRNYNDVQHEMVEDTSKAVIGEGCLGVSETHYHCKNCDYAYVEYDVRGHRINTVTGTVEEGKSCLDGITVTGTCVDCNQVIYSYKTYEHNYQYMYLSQNGNETCYHDISLEICQNCGDCRHFNHYGSNMTHSYDEATKTETQTCTSCGIVYTRQEVQTATGTCTYKVSVIYTLQVGDTVYSYTEDRGEGSDHSDEYDISYELLDPALGCEGGVMMNYSCKDCKEMLGMQMMMEHMPVVEKKLDLSSCTGACAAHYITVMACLCGDQETVADSDLFENEMTTAGSTMTYTCPTCQLSVSATQRDMSSACIQAYQMICTVSYGGNTVYTTNPSMEIYENHKVVQSVTLSSDKTFITIKYACERCGKIAGQEESYPVHFLELNEEHTWQMTSQGLYFAFTAIGDPSVFTAIFANTSMNAPYVTIYDSEWKHVTSNSYGASFGGETKPALTAGAVYYAYIEYRGMMGEIQVGYFNPATMHSHEWEERYLLSEGSFNCQDGLLYYSYCTACGEVELHGLVEGHRGNQTNVDLSAHSDCGHYFNIYACFCGYEYKLDFDSYNFDYDDSTKTYTCRTCSLSVMMDQSQKTENCVTTQTLDIRVFKGDVVIWEKSYISKRDAHNSHATATLLGGEGSSCDDGVLVQYICRNCNKVTSEYTTHGHYTVSANIDLTGYTGICSYHYINVSSCPCGEEQYVYSDYSQTGACSCGFKVTVTDNTTTENCYRKGTVEYVFAFGETEIKRITVNHDEYVHDYEEHVELVTPGTSCEDGIYVSQKCTACGDEQDKHTSYGHYRVNNWVDFSKFEGVCSHHYAEMWSCACGEYSDVKIDFWGDEVTEGNTHSTTCRECGVVYQIVDNTKTENCHRTGTVTHVFYKGTTELVSFQVKVDEEAHSYGYVTTLKNPNGTCEDGVIISYECLECGYSYGSSYETTSHESHELQRVDVNTNCMYYGEHYISIYGCACGYYMNVNNNFYGMHTDLGNNSYSITCDGCNLVLTVTEVLTTNGCHVTGTVTYVITQEGKEVGRLVNTVDRYEHKNTQETVTLVEGATSCTDGVIVCETCTDCGKQVSERSINRHYQVSVSYEFNEGSCYHSAYFSYCACGEYNTHDINLYGIVTDGANGEKTTCQNCGMYVLVLDQTTVLNCRRTGNIVYSFYTSANVLIKSHTVSINTEEHNVAHRYTLAEGATSCLQGVNETEYCTACGKDLSHYTYSYHRLNDSNIISVGGTCGSTLIERRCVCGEEVSYSLNENCDFERVYTDNGIIYRCAVNEPAICGCVIYKETKRIQAEGSCDYYTQVVWHIGYNQETGTSTRTLTESQKYGGVSHSTVSDDKDPVTDTTTGNTTYQGGYHCSVCQNYYEITTKTVNAAGQEIYYKYEYRHGTSWENSEYTREYNGNLLIKQTGKFGSHYTNGYEYTTTTYTYDANGNLLSDAYTVTYTNGEKLESEASYMYYNGYRFTTNSYSQRLDEKGNIQEYSKMTATYDFSNGCMRTVTYEYLNGYKETYTENVCQYIGGTEITPPTCTQEGLHGSVCMVCQKHGDTYAVSPSGHYWMWDDAKGTYVCSNCKLENSTGYNGDIIFEDFTASRGNGVNYVAGYYKYYNSGEMTVYVSLILHNPAEGQDAQVLLTGVSVTDDGKTLTISKADVVKAAEALGYKDATAYDVRVSLVPIGTANFDYSITFTA